MYIFTPSSNEMDLNTVTVKTYENGNKYEKKLLI